MSTSAVPLTLPRSERQPADLQKAAKITAIVGIAHAILLVAAILIVRQTFPGVDAPDTEYAAFLNDESRKSLALAAGIYLLPFAGIAFIWFTVALRAWLQGSIRSLNRLLADVLLVCGIIYVTLLFCNGASIATVALHPPISGTGAAIDSFRDFPLYGRSLFLIFAMRMAAMTVFAISNIGRASGAFPRWFAFSGFGIGAFLLLTASLNPLLALLFPAWIAGLCVMVLRRARSQPVEDDGEGAPREEWTGDGVSAE